ncbi:MAG: hypothetical protein CM15mP126_3380 [Gammaproteobacteria bacterium]|nr:MAG: hypothetical protein CM15mP126_3380 [Gammaproteobacteria bacterium]
MLESHGGNVSLVEITDSKDIVLQFGGGSRLWMIDVTLKDGLKKH